jgi:hypothetical protein
MKKLFIIYFALMSSMVFAGTGKKTGVPSDVTSAFSKANPSATQVKWDQEDSYYEASYKLNGRNMLAVYNNKGEVLEVDTEMKWEEFPAEVQTSMMELGGSKFYYWYSTVDENNQTVYGCWYKRDHDQFAVVLNSKGYLIEKREIKETYRD